jgi:uncharacterized membrane protein
VASRALFGARGLRASDRTIRKRGIDDERRENGTHGVFAVAITLLVLEIRVPDAASIDSGSALTPTRLIIVATNLSARTT